MTRSETKNPVPVLSRPSFKWTTIRTRFDRAAFSSVLDCLFMIINCRRYPPDDKRQWDERRCQWLTLAAPTGAFATVSTVAIGATASNLATLTTTTLTDADLHLKISFEKKETMPGRK